MRKLLNAIKSLLIIMILIGVVAIGLTLIVKGVMLVMSL